jgi:hypothetical protein
VCLLAMPETSGFAVKEPRKTFAGAVLRRKRLLEFWNSPSQARIILPFLRNFEKRFQEAELAAFLHHLTSSATPKPLAERFEPRGQAPRPTGLRPKRRRRIIQLDEPKKPPEGDRQDT